MALDLSTNSAEIQEAIAEVRDAASETNWCLLGYAGKTNTVKLVEKDDDGIDGLAQVQYGYLNVVDPNTQLTKYVIINWAGDAASTAQKGALPRHSRDIADMLRGAHVTINARCEEDCDEETILDKVSRAAGANYSNQERGKKADPKFANTEAGAVSSTYKNKYKQEGSSTQGERAGFWGSEDAAEKERVLAEKAEKASAAQAQDAERKQVQAESDARRAGMQAKRDAELAAANSAAAEQAAAAAAEEEAAAAAAAEDAAAADAAAADAAAADAAAAAAAADDAAYAAQQEQDAAAEADAAAAAEADANAAAQAQADADAAAAAAAAEEEDAAAAAAAADDAAYAAQQEQEAAAEAEAAAAAEAAAEADANAAAHAQAEAEAAAAADVEEVPAAPVGGGGAGQCAKAIYDYQATGEDEVTFDPEEILEDIEMVDEGWWIGTVRGTRGLFPANYVELIE